ncbi:MAG TPA: alanine racemase [Patescibacteria group bacterium]|nr:alanine racemase [Patescibacteria group bacterium]
MLPKQYLHSWVDIDTQAITKNIQFLADCAKKNGKDFMLMVKADAYGHGLVEVSQLAEQMDAVFLGVANLEDVMTLRREGIKTPVLLCTEPSPDNLPLLQKHSVVPVVGSLPFLKAVMSFNRKSTLGFHLKINSGLGRYGFSPEAMPEVLAALGDTAPALQGVLTHYSSADNPQKTKQEFDRFWQAFELIQNAGHTPRYIHASNSAATAWFDESQTNLVRLGLSAYGLQPSDTKLLPLAPTLRWCTRLTSISHAAKGDRAGYGGTWVAEQDSVIGVMSLGYSDGFRRTPRHQEYVLCGGKRLPIIGNVMMNHTILDLTDVHKELAVGDEIVVVGSQGSEQLTLEKVAEQLGTSNEEVVTTISPHLPRFYI